MRIGAAVHSVRAVPRGQLATVGAVPGPRHVHVSEQPAENAACLSYYGLTPTGLLDAEGLLGARTTAVHATHVSGDDITALGRSGATACFCPTTERDLADGIGPARALLEAGARLALGSDQHAVIDLLEEARALELHERLESRRRGRFDQSQLLDALTWAGHASIGWPEVGRIAVGAPADLVAVRLDSVRTAGSQPDQVIMSGAAVDVHTVLVNGREIVSGGVHALGDVGALLSAAIKPLGKGPS
jgi:formiminoglutamate deiminase